MASDGFNFLKILTTKRIWNVISVFCNYWFSLVSRKPFVNHVPFSLSIEPTNLCNLNCPECPAGMKTLTRREGFMSIGLYEKVLDETGPYLIWLMLYFQGESFLHPDLPFMISYAKQQAVYVHISTNGHFLDKKKCDQIVSSGLDRITISLDGLDSETYAEYRVNGHFEKVINGIRNLVQIREERKTKKPFIVIQFLVMKHNEHQIQGIKRLGKEMGVDKVSIKSAQIFNYSGKEEKIPQNRKYSRYIKQKGEITIKNKHKNRCFRVWSSAVITWDGLMVPCCFDKNADHILGEVHRQTVKEIWTGESFMKFRQFILQNRKQFRICQNCTEGLYK